MWGRAVDGEEVDDGKARAFMELSNSINWLNEHVMGEACQLALGYNMSMVDTLFQLSLPLHLRQGRHVAFPRHSAASVDLKSAPVVLISTKPRFAHARKTRNCQPYERYNSSC